nr:MupA/Atu3671 family FMN-dependent luciferase-like monooxygenase [Paenibacillus xylanexedens]
MTSKHSKSFSSELSTSLRRLAGGSDQALYIILLSGISYLLYRYTGERQIKTIIEPLTSDMADSGFQDVRMEMDPRFTYKEWLEHVKAAVIRASDEEWAEVPLSISGRPFEQVIVLMNRVHGITMEGDSGDHTLVLAVQKEGPSIVIELSYSAKAYSDISVTSFLDRLIPFFEQVLNRPDEPMTEIQIVSQEEIIQLHNHYNSTEWEYKKDALIHQLLEEQVERKPHKLAVGMQQTWLNYEQLNGRVNQLARFLQQWHAAAPGVKVGIIMERSVEMVMCLWAILKSGAAYVPIDPLFPKDRVEHILKDSGIALVVAHTKYSGMIDSLTSTFELTTVFWEDIQVKVDTLPDHNLDAIGDSEQLAYLMYTSGSTGKPKGVMVSHRNVVNFFNGMKQALPLEENDTFLSVTTISFDISVLELLWTMTRGMTVILSSDKIQQYGEYDKYIETSPVEMDFGIYFFSSVDGGVEQQSYYNFLIEASQYADRNGFSSVWMPERHFHEFGGYFPNPSVTSAAVALATDNIRVCAGSVVSPLHSPIRIAEEWAVVDQLSKGRVGISFASGWHKGDFVIKPEQYEQRSEFMKESVKKVQKLWSGLPIEAVDPDGDTVQVYTYPRPVQEELPVWITASGNPETFRYAGETGANILTHMLGQTIEQLQENLKIYKDAAIKAGYKDSKVTLMLHTYIGDSLDHVKEVVKAPFCNYLRSNLNLLQRTDIPVPADLSNLPQDENMIDQLIEIAFERYWNSAALFGTEDSVREFIGKLHQIGVTEIASLVDFGLNHEEIMEGLVKLSSLQRTFDRNFQHSQPKRITTIQTTPSRLKIMVEDSESHQFLNQLSNILIGGESIPLTLVKDLRKITEARLFNMYGPTETTVWSAVQELLPETEQLAVGKPIINTQIYVVDENRNQQPVGAVGEIAIGGDGLASGYWNQQELTDSKFIADGYGCLGNKIYLTGDMGIRLEDGSIKLIGRKDLQVKIRGYRIEIEEVENALMQEEGIQSAAVVSRSDENGDTRLVAYLVWDTKRDIEEMRRSLGNRLPTYMIPTLFIDLHSLPLTPNGKIDRIALIKKYTRAESTTSKREPGSSVEETLRNVWIELLGVSDISLTDNFFSKGGDSIKIIQLASKLKSFGLQIKPNDLFRFPTIKKLSPYVTVSSALSRESKDDIEGEIGITPIQHWFFSQKGLERAHYNHAVMLYSEAGFSQHLVRKVFESIAEHHPMLGAVFRFENNRWIQSIHRKAKHKFTIETIHLDSEDHDRLSIEINKTHTTLDLESGKLIGLKLFRTATGDHLQIVIHHLVVDGVSWRILLDDFEEGYSLLSQNKAIQFNKSDGFGAWSQYLQRYVNDEHIAAETIYWNEIQTRKVEPLPKDHRHDTSHMSDTLRETVSLSREETELLLNKALHSYNAETPVLLLVALTYALHEWSEEHLFRVFMEGHGRHTIDDELDLSRTVGWFTVLYPVLLEMSSEKELPYQIKATKEMMKNIPNNGIGYGALKYLKENQPLEDVREDIIFNYLGQFDQDFNREHFQMSKISPGQFISSSSTRSFSLEIGGYVQDQILTINFDYSRKEYRSETIGRLSEAFLRKLRQVIEHCSNSYISELTPSDLGVDLTIDEFEEYLRHI